MSQQKQEDDVAALDKLIAEIMVDAYGDSEGYSAFQATIEDETEVPCEGIVIGEPVTIVEWDFDGNERRGVTSKCRRKDGAKYIVAAWEVTLPRETKGARYLAAYRRWMGLEPYQTSIRASTAKDHSKKIESGDIDLDKPIEVMVDAVKERALQCRVLGSERRLTLRTSGLEETVPGEVITVKPKKQWTYAGHEYLSGEITATRIEVKALGLVSLKLKESGIWAPDDVDWGPEGPSVDVWTKMLPLNASGRRTSFEMEQVLPGAEPEDDNDPIIEANELRACGDVAGARKMLMELCRADLRCLDAHAHLGNLVFEQWPAKAIRHYEVGMRIGELSLGEGFDGVLPWGLIDNRPFLRCMQGYGLCLWRLGRFEDAEGIFRRMLRLNPADNQGVRFLLDKINAKQQWREDS